MLASLRSQMGALTLRPAAGSAFMGRVARATLSTTAVEGETAAVDDDTAAFLSSTSPAEPRTVKTVKRAIRASPRKLTYLAQQIRGLPANEAILQMKFSPKRKAEIFQKTVQNAINLADIKYQIEPENLMVAECFVNKGTYLKRLRIMGRGRSGVMHHPHTHLTVILREFDPSKKPLNRHLTKKLARENAKKQLEKEATAEE
ncbi:ribosomal protein L22 [Phytophthora nicotianae CJ01A1]|uniref:Ribosomal protein L22 n=5 Tax=Phytophthora nicotianae TaxID=4792 RepID=W2QJS2_PHYN3|nr:ribosomal protein L22 [Phytophthora nicotianae INRA-310]ETI52689.1 ribosomal protein L22 [Phytophthora nicotianae P1569]ETK92578.1 ribosomal protein L22 [Phytophthora nicotianae]ETO81387.1 ribosomal protein L22 [Phytophthora nicotianae P1976]ETP22543.1 ribosomal protein L22 [Phytophthora nicotianae CJ01A1]KUF95628.1 39S ribosomal protein L22 [Phytophthora nicotianae]